MNTTPQLSGSITSLTFGKPDPDPESGEDVTWIDDGHTYVTIRLDNDEALVHAGRVAITYEDVRAERMPSERSDDTNADTREASAVPQADQPSGDKYHTMEELYEYRMLYNAHAVRGWLAAGIAVVKSHRHHDGEECFGGGWFIVTAQLPSGQVSNHYRDEFWNLFDCPEVETAPEWDGHTPQIAAERLRAALNSDQPSAEPTEAEIAAATRAAMDQFTAEGWEAGEPEEWHPSIRAALVAARGAREVSGR